MASESMIERAKAELVERIARAWCDDVFAVTGIGRDGQRALYLRRRGGGEDDEFEAVAGPFDTDQEAKAAIESMRGKAILAAIRDAGCAVVNYDAFPTIVLPDIAAADLAKDN